MKKSITQLFCLVLFFGTLTISGCGGGSANGINSGTKEEVAELEAQTAKAREEYAKSMAEANKKGN